jgi:hypothetical protein
MALVLHLGGVGKWMRLIWKWSAHGQESGDLQVVVCMVAAVTAAATAVGASRYSRLINLVLWYAHSLFPLFWIHLSHGCHLQVHGHCNWRSIITIHHCVYYVIYSFIDVSTFFEVKSSFYESPLGGHGSLMRSYLTFYCVHTVHSRYYFNGWCGVYST